MLDLTPVGPGRTVDDAMTDELDKWYELHRVIAEEIGSTPDIWPDHRNAPLAIAATFMLVKGRAEQAEAALAEAREDAERLTWLEHHLHSADFHYGDPPTSVITFAWPPQIPIGVNLRAAIDAARGKGGIDWRAIAEHWKQRAEQAERELAEAREDARKGG